MAWKQCNDCLGFGEVVNGDGTKDTCSVCAGSGQVADVCPCIDGKEA